MYRNPPESLEEFSDLAKYLESLLNDSCSVIEDDGKLILLQIKALVDNVRGIKIEIYPNEHHPPHFHVKSANFQASFRIDDCTRIAGSISSGDYDKIRYWHKYSKSKLIEVWNKMRPTNCVVGYYQEK